MLCITAALFPLFNFWCRVELAYGQLCVPASSVLTGTCCFFHCCLLQIIGVNSSLFVVDIAVLVAMYFAACIFVVGVLAWRHRVRNG
jgi:hypothetical protein